MKKSFNAYALIWAIFLAIFNAVVFLVRPIVPGYVISYDARFWIAWVFILAAFSGNLACAYFAFKAENLKKMFYRFPLITVSLSALIIMLVVGCALMLIPDLPVWIAAVVCILVFAFNVIATIKASWAGEAVSDVDEKVKSQTTFIKLLTVDAENLMNRAKSDAAKAECKKVYEAVCYSDPMSNEALSVAEAGIIAKFDELTAAVGADDDEKISEIAREVVLLVKERNSKCKVLK